MKQCVNQAELVSTRQDVHGILVSGFDMQTVTAHANCHQQALACPCSLELVILVELLRHFSQVVDSEPACFIA